MSHWEHILKTDLARYIILHNATLGLSWLTGISYLQLRTTKCFYRENHFDLFQDVSIANCNYYNS